MLLSIMVQQSSSSACFFAVWYYCSVRTNKHSVVIMLHIHRFMELQTWTIFLLCFCRYVPNRGFNKFQVENMNTTIREILQRVLKRRKVKIRPGTSLKIFRGTLWGFFITWKKTFIPWWILNIYIIQTEHFYNIYILLIII